MREATSGTRARPGRGATSAARQPKPARVVARAEKAAEILDVAERLFATRPFHEVLLDDIAAQARVGKGTVYLHWKGKEEVYLAVIRRGFQAVLSRIEEQLPELDGRAWQQLGVVVGALVEFAFAHPGVYQLMRAGVVTPEDPTLAKTRARLTDRIESVIRGGVANGELSDPCPGLTTQFLLSCVRAASLYPVKGMTRESLAGHILHLLRHGIAGGGV